MVRLSALLRPLVVTPTGAVTFFAGSTVLGMLASQAGMLQEAVDQFLERVAAA